MSANAQKLIQYIKNVINASIFKDIAKDSLQDIVDKLVKNGTLFNKRNRDKDSQRINGDEINDPSGNISPLSTHSSTTASPTISRQFS